MNWMKKYCFSSCITVACSSWTIWICCNTFNSRWTCLNQFHHQTKRRIGWIIRDCSPDYNKLTNNSEGGWALQSPRRCSCCSPLTPWCELLGAWVPSVNLKLRHWRSIRYKYEYEDQWIFADIFLAQYLRTETVPQVLARNQSGFLLKLMFTTLNGT